MCQRRVRLSWQEWRTPEATWQIRIVTPHSDSIVYYILCYLQEIFILTTLAPLRQVRKLPFWGESLLRKLHSEIVWLSGQILGSNFISYKNNAFRWWQESGFPWKTIFWKNCHLECIIGPLLGVLSWRLLGLIVTRRLLESGTAGWDHGGSLYTTPGHQPYCPALPQKLVLLLNV